MIVNAQDLFQTNSSQAATQVVSTATSSNTNVLSLDPLSFLAKPETFASFISQLNYFALGWSIFYSILFTADFFFCRMYFTDGEVGKEELGVDSIHKAASIWWSYLIAWFFYFLYSFFPFFGLLTILVYFWKLLSADMPKVLAIIHNHVGYNGVFGFYRKITDPIGKLFSLNFKKKK